MDEPVDAVAPWTIKSVATATRDAVTKAARQEGLTVGQWLERRVAEWLEDGGPVRVSRGALVPVSRGQPASETRADHNELRDLVHMARDLTPPDKDSAVLRLARATVRDRLKGLKANGVA